MRTSLKGGFWRFHQVLLLDTNLFPKIERHIHTNKLVFISLCRLSTDIIYTVYPLILPIPIKKKIFLHFYIFKNHYCLISCFPCRAGPTVSKISHCSIFEGDLVLTM